MNKSQELGGIFGVCVGDALGMSVEFRPRSQPNEISIKDIVEQLEIIHQVSPIIHAHPRSQMSRGFYVFMVIELLRGSLPQTTYEKMKKTSASAYSKAPFEA